MSWTGRVPCCVWVDTCLTAHLFVQGSAWLNVGGASSAAEPHERFGAEPGAKCKTPSLVISRNEIQFVSMLVSDLR